MANITFPNLFFPFLPIFSIILLANAGGVTLIPETVFLVVMEIIGILVIVSGLVITNHSEYVVQHFAMLGLNVSNFPIADVN